MRKYFDGYASFEWNKMSNQKLVVELKEKCRYIAELKQIHKEQISKIQSSRDKLIADIQSQLAEKDKTIAELEEQLENYKLCRCVDCSTEYEKGLETSIDELENENQQLKQSQKTTCY